MGKVKVLIPEAREATATKLQVSAVVGIAMFTSRTVSTMYFPGVLISGIMSERNVKCNLRL
jgi:hypothetical protein